MKSIRVRMKYQDGSEYFWTIRRVPRAINCSLGKTHIISGWEFTDHEGYTRFVEGNWSDLVPHFRLVAENYGMTCQLS